MIIFVIGKNMQAAPTHPTVSVSFPKTKNIIASDDIRDIIPHINQIRPQYLWANTHVLSLFIDLEVL